MKKSEQRLINNTEFAKFMECTHKVLIAQNKAHVGGSWVYLKDLKYDTSWDWLIPVAKKCSDICYNHSGKITNNIFNLNSLELQIRYMVAQYDIDKSYTAILSFIKNYKP